MFFIVETQVDDNGQGATIVTTKETRNEADSEFYRILQAAAISNVPIHGAIIINEEAMPIMNKAYIHSNGETLEA